MMKPILFLATLSILAVCACKPATPEQDTTADEPGDTESSHGFDVLSSDYYQAQSRVIWQKPDLVLNLLGDLKGKTVADIGAGTGFFAFRVANEGAKVIAIDIDPRAIEWINSEKVKYPVEVRTLLETRLATPDDPNLQPQEADLVLMVNTYIYISDRIAYFNNLRKGLGTDAEVIIIDFKDTDTPIGPAPQERIGMSQVQKELAKAGYRVSLADSTSLEYQYIIKAAK